MIQKLALILAFLLTGHLLIGQPVADAWMDAQLGEISWQKNYKGVLADFHPIALELAADQHQIAGYLIHQGDQRKHKLIGDWSKSGHFQLQERDEYERLTGYLTGTITNDQVQMKWMSADQSRLFDVKAFPESLIKIKSFKPAAEWIEISGTPAIQLSVQKMEYGIVSGMTNLGGHYTRFDGNCLDGTCSIWNTIIRHHDGTITTLQMRQKDQATYKATLDGVEYKADIKYTAPLTVKQFDISEGFLDFVYPQLQSKTYDLWLAQRIDSLWNDGVRQLTTNPHPEQAQRLAYRSSGWVEIIDEGETYISGMITYINPDVVHREVFVWLKKEDVFVNQHELVNSPADLSRASEMALASVSNAGDNDYFAWLSSVGYSLLIPTSAGIAMTTEFNMVFGDELSLLPLEESKAMIRRKYWKYFGW